MSDRASEPAIRADWDRRVGRRTRRGRAVQTPALDAPRIEAADGVGHVMIEWEPVDGAVGYAIFRRQGPGAEFELLDHGGGDVLAVPGPPYADTTGPAGRTFEYAVAALAAADVPPGPLSEPVPGTALDGGDGSPLVGIDVRADRPDGPTRRPWWMIGSERLSLLHDGAHIGDRPIGRELDEALRLAVSELGATGVRAHAILHDDLGVYRRIDGAVLCDFSAMDRIYDRLVDLGLRPIVELSFMPRDLAADSGATVFTYEAITSPPRELDAWRHLVTELARHLVERYGAAEVSEWAFEVWNEPNLDVFWSGTQRDYFRLYEASARAIKSVDARLRVGGPSTAAAGWVIDFLEFCSAGDVPLDFLSTHVYGVPPLDLRASATLAGRQGIEVWWTEWGVTPTHFAPVNDSVFGAPFVLRGIKGAQKTADALAYWVVSDHFEELGRPERLFHGGFGLLTVGNLRKPRYWAIALANQLGPESLFVELSGDGAGGLVDAVAARGGDGSVDVLMWNGTLDQSKSEGHAPLDRRVRVRIAGLDAASYAATVAAIDAGHSNIASLWNTEDAWPDEMGWERLRAADRLFEWSPGRLDAVDGAVEAFLDLPMPGVARVRVVPD